MGAKATQASIEGVLRALRSYRIRYGHESSMQDDVAKILKREGIPYRREQSLTKADRPDFFLAELGLAIECKVHGGLATVIAQVQRYLKMEEVRRLVLVTSRAGHGAIAQLRGKPVDVVYVTGVL